MKVTFYGTRGSIPIPGKDFVQFGGNTSCVLITFDTNRIVILDAGTGIRRLGNHLVNGSHEQYDNIFIVLSHTHWDHIQGFPFFRPAYDPRRQFTITICGKDKICRALESIFAAQMQSDYFPVPLDKMGAKFIFWQPNIDQYTHPEGVEVEVCRLNHPGNAYAYRFTAGEKTLVYCTDVEYGDEVDQNVVRLSRHADLLIHDAQYTPTELKKKKGWGHSSWGQAVEVAEQAHVKKLALFHHDPEHSDRFLLNEEKKCQKRFPNAFFAREGTTIEL